MTVAICILSGISVMRQAMSSEQTTLLDKANELCWKMEQYCQQEWNDAKTPLWIALMEQLNDIIKILDHGNGEVNHKN